MPLLRDLFPSASPALWCCAAVIALALTVGTARSESPSNAAGPTIVGVFGAWRAATHHAAGRLVCYAYTRSVSSAPHLAGRDAAVLSVTEREGAPRDAVALGAGYAYPQGSSVLVEAGGSRLRFYTAGRSAFARSGEGAVRAFQAAHEATARSSAPHGRSVSDVFSLDGFVSAHRAIEKACPRHA